MNMRPGIDTPPPSGLLFAKLNLPFDDRARAIEVLKAIEAVRLEALDPARRQNDRGVADGWGLNLLVGFGLRFFLGPLEKRKDEVAIQNFPPGGDFPPRTPTRFGMKDRKTPLYLRTMAAAGDDAWVAKRLAKKSGKAPTPEEVKAAYAAWLSKAESDLFLYIEGNLRFLRVDLWERIQRAVVEPFGLELAGPIQESYGSEDGRDLIGWFDPISNMDDMMKADPERYRRHIYLPHPAPGYPGEPLSNRDDLVYNGGTYMVHRKYREDLARWNSDAFSITDAFGRTWKGEEARRRTMGRDRMTGKVVSASSGRLLDKEPDSAEAVLAPVDAHIMMARGANPAPFEAPFPPLSKGETNVFNLQDIRIRRRGGNWLTMDPATGQTDAGLHFICFQNNIQQTGFEFINNVWLINPMFRLKQDHILNLETGIGEPMEGCYYFVPPEHMDYPGDVFFGGGR